MSSPGLKPAASIALTQNSSAASADGRFGAKPPSSPTLVLWPAFFSAALQRMEDLRAPAHGFGEGRRADRQDHELLEVDRVVGVDAAIDDVHHRRRQHAGHRPADIAVERQAGRFGRRLGDRQRHAEDGVGAEPRLVGRAVERDHRLVDLELVLRLEARDRVEQVAVDRLDRLQDALAAVAALVAVAQLDRLARARSRRPTERRRGPSSRPRGSRRPRPSDCRGCRGFRGRRR